MSVSIIFKPKKMPQPPEEAPPSPGREKVFDATARKTFLLYLRRILAYFLSFSIILHLLWAYETPYAFVLRAFMHSLPAVLLALLPALLPMRVSRFYLLISYIFITAPAFICAVHLSVFQTPVSAQSFFALFDINPTQAGGLSLAHLSWRLCLAAAAITIIPAWLLHRALKSPPPPFNRLWAGLLLGISGTLVVLALAVGPITLLRGNIISDAYVSLAEFGDYMARLRADLHKSAGLSFSDVRLTTPPEEERTLVVVIGESANRTHHSVYGYKRNTTPNLITLSGELVVFKDIISTCPDPADHLNEILALPGRDGQGRPLFTLFNQAGFHTYWLSNQPDIQDGSSETTVLTAQAYGSVQLNRGGATQYSPGLDSVLLDPLEKILHDDPDRKIIFIRLMGSRPEYALRAPSEFARFTHCADVQASDGLSDDACAQLNDYDNSIAYTDAILKDIIALTGRLAPESALVYFSDHGAAAYGPPYAADPHSGVKSIHYYEIPFLIWLSQGFRAANPDYAVRWPQYTERRSSLHDFAYTLAQLAGVTFSDYDPTRSLLSENFTPRPRLVQDWNYDTTFPFIRLDGDAETPDQDLHEGADPAK